jgi:fatty acid-binding protein DegV
VEFSIEFDDIEQAVIVHNKSAPSETTRLLHERLKTEFEGREFPTAVYTPTLATMIGTDAHGFVILELENESSQDHDHADD